MARRRYFFPSRRTWERRKQAFLLRVGEAELSGRLQLDGNYRYFLQIGNRYKGPFYNLSYLFDHIPTQMRLFRKTHIIFMPRMPETKIFTMRTQLPGEQY